jgi:hypothetical protein
MTMSTQALLRDARATGEMVAALDHLLQLGYELERAKRACGPYVHALTINAHPIVRSRVLAVYTGKQGCMCGCKGNYRYPEARRAEFGDAVNEAVITRVINKVRAAGSANVEVTKGFGDEIIYIVDNAETGRRMAVYAQAVAQ